MAVNTKQVKKRIKSVKNTKKITKAMEMVAAAKMRKSVNIATKTKDYANMATYLMQDLCNSQEVLHILMQPYEKIEKILLIIISSNRGLCGSYNNNITKAGHKFIQDIRKEYSQNTQIDVIAIGKKGAQFAKKNGLNILEIYEKFPENPTYTDILPMSKSIISNYIDNQHQKVYMIFTNYISGLNQKVETKQLLPFIGLDDIDEKENSSLTEFKFEPEKNEVLDYIVPRLVEIQLYQAVLDSLASEHSNRMIAMKNASDSAGEMIHYLTLDFNKARQANVTREISEIVSGADALN